METSSDEVEDQHRSCRSGYSGDRVRTVNLRNINSVHKLNVLYSNLDVFTKDKMLELSARIKAMDSMPNIIALHKVKPKNAKYERISEEYKLKEYDYVSCNLST